MGRCAGQQEPLHRVARAHAPGGKSCALLDDSRRCAVRQETLLQTARGHARAASSAPGRQEIVRFAAGAAPCGRAARAAAAGDRTLLRAAGHAAASGRSCGTGGRSRSTGAGSVAKVAGAAAPKRHEALHRVAGAAAPCGWSPGVGRRCARRKELLPCGRSSSRCYCCGRQELLRWAAGDTAPTAKPRRRQEPLHWAAKDAVTCGRSRCTGDAPRHACRGQEPRGRRYSSPCQAPLRGG